MGKRQSSRWKEPGRSFWWLQPLSGYENVMQQEPSGGGIFFCGIANEMVEPPFSICECVDEEQQPSAREGSHF